ncbi:MAG: hypothetical protein K2P81_14435 [Bacteriovoracaceae bacterium]|nr:hypothetical protein [Bacteriovoracaceae bacterium]
MKAIIALVCLFVALSAFAQGKCEKEAKKFGYQAANQTFGMESEESRSVCGATLLDNGDFIETYIVGISDEVEPSEFIVILDKKTCKKKFAAVSKDSASRFDYSDNCKKY